MQWNQYLASIKRTEKDLEQEFRPHAEKRVKSALALRHLTKELNVTVNDEEVNAEIVKLRGRYKEDKNAEAEFSRPEYREYITRILLNRKTIDNLVSLLVE